MSPYVVWRIIPSRPGCVDFCGTVEAATLAEAEDVARLMYPCDDYLSVEMDDELSVPTGRAASAEAERTT